MGHDPSKTLLIAIAILASQVSACTSKKPDIIHDDPSRPTDGRPSNQIIIDDQILSTGKDGAAILGYTGGSKWPGATIIFDTSTLSPSEKLEFYGACNAWANGTPLTCKERTNERGYVRVRTHFGDQCDHLLDVSCSPIGFKNYPQDMYIYTSHWNNQYVLRHEIGHTLGLWHEQNRKDREAYVNVYYGNVKKNTEHNFDIQDGTRRSPYDFVSIMHYNHCAFSKHDDCNEVVEEIPNKWTLSHSACDMSGPLGSASISFLDLESIRSLYFGIGYRELFDAKSFVDDSKALYSRSQIATIDRTLFKQYTPAIWTRQWTHFSDSGKGGFLANIDEKRLCASRGQEHERTWYDHDNHIFYNTTERWIRCGCSHVSITFRRLSSSPTLVRNYPANLFSGLPKPVDDAGRALFSAIQNLDATVDGKQRITELDKSNLYLAFLMNVQSQVRESDQSAINTRSAELSQSANKILSELNVTLTSVRSYDGKGSPTDPLYELFERNGFTAKHFFR